MDQTNLDLAVVSAIFFCMACFGLFLSGIAAMLQVRLNRSVLKLRREQMKRELIEE